MNSSLWRLLHVLVLLSGAAALVYQVTWVRDLTLVFGGSFQATSIVLASFMGGLSLGGFLSGRYGYLEELAFEFAFVIAQLDLEKNGG